jgi:hypothetical protein
MSSNGHVEWRALLGLAALGALCWSPSAFAQLEAEAEEAVKAELNPITRRYTLPLENSLDLDIGPYERVQYTLKLQPVTPIRISEDWAMIIRTILPIRAEPDEKAPTGGTFGLQDALVTFFLSQRRAPDDLSWGIGPALMLPTATAMSLGTGKWSLGPSAAVLFEPPPWTVGFLVNNVWSVAGSGSRGPVNQFQFQYFLAYRLGHGWYLSSSPTFTANWEKSSQDQWTVPLGGGVGKSIKIGGPHLNVKVEGYYNVVRPQEPSAPPWQLRVNLTFVFPAV